MTRPTDDEIYRNHRDLQSVDVTRAAIEAQIAGVEAQKPPPRDPRAPALSLEDAIAKDLKTGQQ